MPGRLRKLLKTEAPVCIKLLLPLLVYSLSTLGLMGEEIRVTTITQDGVMMNAGAAAGVKQGMSGTVYFWDDFRGGKIKSAVSKFIISKVENTLSEARITKQAGEVKIGYLVEFDETLVPPSQIAAKSRRNEPAKGASASAPTITAKSPADILTLFEQADKALARKEFDTASALYKRILEAYPDDPGAKAKLEESENTKRVELDNTEERLKAERALETKRLNMNLGTRFMDQKDYELALLYFRKIQEDFPDDVQVKEKIEKIYSLDSRVSFYENYKTNNGAWPEESTKGFTVKVQDGKYVIELSKEIDYYADFFFKEFPVERDTGFDIEFDFEIDPITDKEQMPMGLWNDLEAQLLGTAIERIERGSMDPNSPCIGLIFYRDDGSAPVFYRFSFAEVEGKESNDSPNVSYGIFARYIKKSGILENWAAGRTHGTDKPRIRSDQPNNFRLRKTPAGIEYRLNGELLSFYDSDYSRIQSDSILKDPLEQVGWIKSKELNFSNLGFFIKNCRKVIIDNFKLVFKLSGQFSPNVPFVDHQWLGSGVLGGGISRFSGVSRDESGDSFVLDAKRCRILKYSSGKKILIQWGSEGLLDGQFKEPTEIATDSIGNVYVLDCAGKRIQKFNNGRFVNKIVSGVAIKGEFDSIRDFVIDENDILLAVDEFAGHSRLIRFDTSGALIDNCELPRKYRYSGGLAVNGSTGTVYYYSQGWGKRYIIKFKIGSAKQDGEPGIWELEEGLSLWDQAINKEGKLSVLITENGRAAVYTMSENGDIIRRFYVEETGLLSRITIDRSGLYHIYSKEGPILTYNADGILVDVLR